MKKIILGIIGIFIINNIVIAEKISLLLKERITINKNDILLKDIIENNKNLSPTLSNVIIAEAPKDERELMINYALIKQALVKAKVDDSNIIFNNNRSFCLVKREVQVIDYQEIKLLAEEYLKSRLNDEGFLEYKINDVKIFNDIKIPLGKYEINFFEKPNSKIYGKVLLKFDVTIDNNLVRTGNIAFDIDAYKEVVVAKTMIRSGDSFSENNVELRLENISKYQSTPCFELSDVIGKISKRTVSANSIIAENMVSEQFLVKKGDEVNIKYTGNNLEIIVKGQAMENGYRNDIIKVKNLSTKKLQEAQVVEEKLVELNF